MLHQLSIKMSEHIVSHASNLESSQTDSIRYAIETLLGEFSKFMILWFLFYAMHLSDLFIISFLVFSSIRVVAGGFHFSSYLTCLIGSFIMYAIILYCHQFIPLTSYSSYLLIILALIPLYIYAPIIPLNRYDYNQNTIHVKRFMAAIMVFILFVLALNTNQVKIYTLSLVVFSLQLLLGGLKHEKLL